MNRRALMVLVVMVALLGSLTAHDHAEAADAQLTAQIKNYLESKNSPLADSSSAFVSAGKRYGVDPRFLVAISGAETSFGTYGPSQSIRNPFGLGPGLRYDTWEAAINFAAWNLKESQFYYRDGRYTIAAIQQRWAPNGAANDPTGLNSHWVKNVSNYYSALGGNPADNVFRGASSASSWERPQITLAKPRGAQPTSASPEKKVTGSADASSPVSLNALLVILLALLVLTPAAKRMLSFFRYPDDLEKEVER